MSGGRRRWTPSGLAWMGLIALPPFLILVLIVMLFVWQARRGEVVPKWRKTKTDAGAVVGTTNGPVPGR